MVTSPSLYVNPQVFLSHYIAFHIQSSLSICEDLVPGQPQIPKKIYGYSNLLYNTVVFANNLFVSSHMPSITSRLLTQLDTLLHYVNCCYNVVVWE